MTPQKRTKVRAVFLEKIFFADNLSPMEKIVINQLVHFDIKGTKQWCNPSQRLLAKRSRAGIRTVERAVRAAVDLGWIETKRDERGRNTYSIKYDALEQYNDQADQWLAGRL
jgi:hypothetical protein